MSKSQHSEMLRIVTGPFHPALDRALVEDIRSCKTDDPFAPLAIIVPSASLVEHLKHSTHPS